VFQSTVFVFDLLQSLQLTAFSAAVLRLPAVIRLLGRDSNAGNVLTAFNSFAVLDDRQGLCVAILLRSPILLGTEAPFTGGLLGAAQI
jgi:hypothetical protein